MRLPVAAVAVLSCVAVNAHAITAKLAFTDVTTSSGIAFRHAASKTCVKFLPETMGGGVAIFDAAGDGRLDLFFTNGAATPEETSSAAPPQKHEPRFWNCLYRNLGGRKLEDVTERSGLAAGAVPGWERTSRTMTTTGDLT